MHVWTWCKIRYILKIIAHKYSCSLYRLRASIFSAHTISSYVAEWNEHIVMTWPVICALHLCWPCTLHDICIVANFAVFASFSYRQREVNDFWRGDFFWFAAQLSNQLLINSEIAVIKLRLVEHKKITDYLLNFNY